MCASLPLLIVGSDILGHNGLGIVPLIVAWGLTAYRLREQPTAAVPVLGRP